MLDKNSSQRVDNVSGWQLVEFLTPVSKLKRRTTLPDYSEQQLYETNDSNRDARKMFLKNYHILVFYYLVLIQ